MARLSEESDGYRLLRESVGCRRPQKGLCNFSRPREGGSWQTWFVSDSPGRILLSSVPGNQTAPGGCLPVPMG